MSSWIALLFTGSVALSAQRNPDPCESLLVSGLSSGPGAAAMGVYVHHERQQHEGHRVFRRVGGSGAPLHLFFSGAAGKEQIWCVSHAVGNNNCDDRKGTVLRLGRGAFARADTVRDDLVGAWDIVWQSAAAGAGPAARRVAVRCVCSTLALGGLPRDAPGREAMGVYQLRHRSRGGGGGGDPVLEALSAREWAARPTYERVGDRLQDRPHYRRGWEGGNPRRRRGAPPPPPPLPPMALFYHRDGGGAGPAAGWWQLARYAHNFHLRVASDAGAPEAILRAGMGDDAPAAASSSGGVPPAGVPPGGVPPPPPHWEVDPSAPEVDAAAVAAAAAGGNTGMPASLMTRTAQRSAHGVTIACACPGVRIGAADDHPSSSSPPSSFVGSTFIFMGSTFGGRRVYAAPLFVADEEAVFERGGVAAGPEMFLWYSGSRSAAAGGKQQQQQQQQQQPGHWVVSPEVGNGGDGHDGVGPRFGRVRSRAVLPELIGRWGAQYAPKADDDAWEQGDGGGGGAAAWEVSQWGQRGHQLRQVGTDVGVALSIACVRHAEQPQDRQRGRASSAAGSASASPPRSGKGAGEGAGMLDRTLGPSATLAIGVLAAAFFGLLSVKLARVLAAGGGGGGDGVPVGSAPRSPSPQRGAHTEVELRPGSPKQPRPRALSPLRRSSSLTRSGSGSGSGSGDQPESPVPRMNSFGRDAERSRLLCDV
jgi:hypothetical protein